MKKNLIFFLIALLLVSCASTAQSPDTSKGPVNTSPTPVGAPTDVPPLQTPDQGGPVIILEKSGGIAGIDQKWTIYGDGRVVSPGQNEPTLDRGQVLSVLADIQKLGFFSFDADYSTLSTCNDCFLYTVTVNSGGRSKTVIGVAGDTHTPAEFSQVIDKINNLITP